MRKITAIIAVQRRRLVPIMVCQLRSRSARCAKTLPVAIIFALAWLISCPPSSHAQQTAKRTPATRTPTKLNPALQEAHALLKQGRLDEAKQKVLSELAANPKSVEAYNLLGIIAVSQKDDDAALDAFQKALALKPASTSTKNNLGNLYAAGQKLDLAEREFRGVLRTEPANAEANYNLGLILLAKNQPAAAVPFFQRVAPPTTESRINLLRAFLLTSKTAAAQTVATNLSARNPKDVQLHFTLGLILASAKQYKSAAIEFEKANALQPDNFDLLYNLGQAYLRSGDYSRAELVLKRAQALKPESPDVLYQLAQVYADQSRAVDALELLVRTHKLAPENTDVIFLLARVSMMQNYFEDAIPLLESGIQLDPRRADLRAALGESYFMSGKTEKAVEEFKKLVETDPTARSYAFLGLSYRHLGRFDEARTYFERGLKADPRNASCLFNLGYIEGRQGNQAKAEGFFAQTLKSNPDFADALLELANLRITAKRFAEAADLLRRYVKVSREPATGYYKLAMVERNLKQFDAAQRDLSVFQTLSKDSNPGPYPYQHLFDYLNNRATLTSQQRTQLDLTEIANQIKAHPGQPQDLYALAEANLKLGKVPEARQAVAQLDQISAADFRMQTGIGVLFGRYRLYDDAITHFQSAAKANPDSDDVKFDLADAYFRQGQFQQALGAAQTVSIEGQKDDAYLALLGDIYSHLGDSAKSVQIFQDAINRNPDNDQYYLSLALAELRAGNLPEAESTLNRGLSRAPSSGKLLWGLGVVSALRGNSPQAAAQLERAVDLLPEWSGSYSTLGVFYYQAGQYDKAREVFSRFKGSRSSGRFSMERIEQALANAPQTSAASPQPLPIPARQQFLQIALSLADRTL